MTSALCLLTSEDLSQLAGALRSGRVAPPFTLAPAAATTSPRAWPARVADDFSSGSTKGWSRGTWPTASRSSARTAGNARSPRT